MPISASTGSQPDENNRDGRLLNSREPAEIRLTLRPWIVVVAGFRAGMGLRLIK